MNIQKHTEGASGLWGEDFYLQVVVYLELLKIVLLPSIFDNRT